MMHQFGEGRERKNRPERVADGLQTGSEKVNLPDVDTYDEIDPADFFDPEEFGIGRRDFISREP